jgi:splicing factor 3A subunit 1
LTKLKKGIVDKTATFVARNGPEFEEKIRQNEINNPKFNFLNSADPYHAYYQHKLREIREGKTSTTNSTSMPPPAAPAQSQQQQDGNNLQNNLQKLNISTKTQDTQSKIIEQMIILKDPPSEFEFILDAPSISPLDIDIIKMTAQFVARNGKPFLTNIMNKEQRNPMFDFLKPAHSHFQYFNKLVEQYTKILLPQKDLLDKMRQEVNNPFGVLKSVAYRVEWEKAAQREKAKENELAEKERVAYAQIDWHDFVVVETVEYQPNEVGNFPPPTTPADVGARVLAQERIEASGGDFHDQLFMERIIEDESRVEVSTHPDHNHTEEQREEIVLAPLVPDKATKPAELPLPPNPDNVIIRRDYDPKAKQNAAASGKPTATQEQYYKSPITGELIPASMMQEHMRISMLNPDWLKQKQKEKKEREEQEEVLASGSNIEANLKRMAEYRSDMFGSGTEETVIGRKKGQNEDNENQISKSDQPQNNTGIPLDDQVKGMSVINHHTIITQSAPQTMTMPPPPSMIIPPRVQPPPMPNQMMMHTHQQPPPPPQMLSAPVQLPGEIRSVPAEIALDEPAAKRQKTEEQLIPESEFLAQYGDKGPVTFIVQVPSVSDKPEWNLNGQTLQLSLPLTETVATIKNKLMEVLSMPNTKQKLQLDVNFFKRFIN